MYDEIGRRIVSVCAFVGVAPLEILTPTPPADARDEIAKSRALGQLRREVGHLSIAPKFRNSRVKFEITSSEAYLRTEKNGRMVERRVSLAYAPDEIFHGQDSDALPLLVHGLQAESFGIAWLPYDELLDKGYFGRMQESKDRLTSASDKSCFYVFVSHRWLTPVQPDPKGLQAALVAWQILGHVIEAVWVAAGRGRHTPRKLSPIGGGTYVGPRGSEFAESIIVNLLRRLPDTKFTDLVAEAAGFDDVHDYGVRSAWDDIGLKTLQMRLAATPVLRETLSRFRIFYDYSCMPQHPRTTAEEEEFESLLRVLGAIQSLGRTLVLLDKVEDYLSRAWCTYESVLSDQYSSKTMDSIEGAEMFEDDLAKRSDRLMSILSDRPAILWRGVLDTEVFGVQTPSECMMRLGLATTRPEDLKLVYRLIRTLGPPPSVHFDDSEVVTGLLPLPIQNESSVVVAQSGRAFDERKPLISTMAIEELPLRRVGPEGLPLIQRFDAARSGSGPVAHAAIFARSEGEAVLYMDWTMRHRADLEQLLGVALQTISWVSSDFAPVGHFATGSLTISPIKADVWVVLGALSTLDGGYSSAVLTESLWAAGIEYVQVAIDRPTDNVRRYLPSAGPSNARKALLRLEPKHPAFKTFEGGLFRVQVLQQLGVRP